MYKERSQLLKEIEKLQEERHSLRVKESFIYTVLAIFTTAITVILIFYSSFIDNISKSAIYMSISLNIITCFFIFRELLKKNTKVYINDSSPINVFKKGKNLYTLSENRLNEILSICIDEEEYELASKVRDELKKFKK